MIKEFCNIVLQKSDSSELSVLIEESKLIEENKEIIINNQYLDYFLEKTEPFKIIVNKTCVQYEKYRITNNLSPYSFYNRAAIIYYRDCLKNLCNQICGIGCPQYFLFVLDWITIKCEEFQNYSIYVHNYVKSSRLSNEKQMRDNFVRFNKNLKDATDRLNLHIKETNKKLKSSEKEINERSITILGIFSAIVLTFNSGLTFSSTVLQNLINSSIYRAIIITIVFGFIIANVLLGLFYYLECVREDASKIKKRLKSVGPMIVLNFILAILLAVSVISWKNGWIEQRDREVLENTGTTSITETSVFDDALVPSTEEQTTNIDNSILTEEHFVVEETTRPFIDVTP